VLSNDVMKLCYCKVSVCESVCLCVCVCVSVRVHEKPYVELKDSDGRADDIVAKEVMTCTVFEASLF